MALEYKPSLRSSNHPSDFHDLLHTPPINSMLSLAFRKQIWRLIRSLNTSGEGHKVVVSSIVAYLNKNRDNAVEILRTKMGDEADSSLLAQIVKNCPAEF